ncbi:MAG: hypothetical protein ACJ72W_22520 [Actinoallomurus sp.]
MPAGEARRWSQPAGVRLLLMLVPFALVVLQRAYARACGGALRRLAADDRRRRG